MLQHLQQLIYLELDKLYLGEWSAKPLQPLQMLTGLADERISTLKSEFGIDVPASMLSGMQYLTRLELTGDFCMKNTIGYLEPGVLAGKTLLQHLDLDSCSIRRAKSGVAQILSHLQHMQQLTHLRLSNSLSEHYADTLPAVAAYAALTASSKLQRLEINDALPVGVLQHMFLVGKQLLQLRCLDLSHSVEWMPSNDALPASELSHMVKCGPHLQSLKLKGVLCSAESLALLQGLSGLYTLHLGDHPSAGRSHVTAEGLAAVCQLTRLRELDVTIPRTHAAKLKEGLLMQLTQLRQLSKLVFYGPLDGACQNVSLVNKVG
jgi:hypothetical protein